MSAERDAAPAPAPAPLSQRGRRARTLCALAVAASLSSAAGAVPAGALSARASAPGCVAAAAGPDQLSFARALRLAMCGNAQLEQASAAIARQLGEQEEAEAAYYPAVNAAVGRTRDEQRFAAQPRSSVSTSNARVTMEWKLLDFGERDANVRAAMTLVEAAQRGRDAALQALVAQLAQTYFDAVSALALAAAKQEADALAAATLGAVQRRAASGMAANGEVEQAAAVALRASIERNRAGGAAGKAQATLKSLLGLSLEAQLHLPEMTADADQAQIQPLHAWLAALDTRHPAILAARLQAGAARAKEDAMRAADKPSLSLSLAHYRNGRPDQALTPYRQSETTVGLAINVPLFDGFAHAGRVKQARAEVARTEAVLTGTAERTALDVSNAYADATSSLDNVALALRLKESAQRALDSVRRRYDKGAADTTEMLSAQAAFIEAADERIRCLSDWRNARLRLLAVSATYDLEQ